MRLSPGQTWTSAVDDTAVIVVRGQDGEVDLACGGVAMTSDKTAEKVAPVGDVDGAALLGKRYVDSADRLELLCTKAGAHALTVDGAPLEIKTARPLPASD
jgi:hypothetical protein